MRWLQTAVLVLSVLAMTGCPSEFGKEGRIAKAVHKDSEGQLGLIRCTKERIEEVCGNGRQHSPECQDCLN
jgi:hypothetical protein